jgi:UDPglucose 6-dehydrogenase
MLTERGARVRAYDPAAMVNAASRLPDVVLCADPFEAATGADAVVLCTPWPEFAALDFATVARAMRGDLVLDGRNLLDASTVEAAGLRYEGIGRGSRKSPTRHVVQVSPGQPA